jgi:hypothetical protein
MDDRYRDGRHLAFAHLIGLSLTDALIEVDQIQSACDDDVVALICHTIARTLIPDGKGVRTARAITNRRR